MRRRATRLRIVAYYFTIVLPAHIMPDLRSTVATISNSVADVEDYLRRTVRLAGSEFLGSCRPEDNEFKM